MATIWSQKKMGFYPFPVQALEHVAALVNPATFANGRMFDPCAGEGVALEALAKAWKLTPFANEFNPKRAAECVKRFGSLNALSGDFFDLEYSWKAFHAAWVNPPFQGNGERGADGEGREEADFLARAWQAVAPGGLLFFISYTHHLSLEVCQDLFHHSDDVRVYRVPGFDLGAYMMTVTVCRVADEIRYNLRQKDIKAAEELSEQARQNYIINSRLRQEKREPNDLELMVMFPDITQTQDRFDLSNARFTKQFKMIFTQKTMPVEKIVELSKEFGPQNDPKLFVSYTHAPEVKTDRRVMITPRFRQLMSLLASGLFNGVAIKTENGIALVRAVTRQVERKISDSSANAADSADGSEDEDDAEEGLTIIKYRTGPETTITVLYEDGKVENITEDAKLKAFIRQYRNQLMEYVKRVFKADYEFDFMNGALKPVLDSYRIVKGKKKFPLYTTQKHVVAAFFARLRRDRAAILCGQMGVGKASRNTARVYTPTGYKLMGEIQVGDQVMGHDGKPTTVLGVFPQGVVDIYRVTFSDGSSTEVTGDHLWEVNTPHRKWAGQSGYVKSLSEITAKPLAHINGNYQNFIPMVEPVQFMKRELLIDPYLLGVLLGDGNLNKSVRFSSADQEIVDAVAELVPQGVHVVRESEYDYRLTSLRRIHNKYGWCTNPLTDALKYLNLNGKTSTNKFIPTDYLYSSVKDRIALLQGLMDTDGCVAGGNNSSVEFVTVSKHLAQDVKELAQSLGATVSVAEKYPRYEYQGEKLTGRLAYRLVIALPSHIIPFRLSRKVEAYNPRTKYEPTRAIIKVEHIGQGEATCIAVDNPRHLYVTDEFIVTHNTAMGSGLMHMMSPDAPEELRAMIDNPIGPNQFNVIVCPPHLVKKWENEIRGMIPNAFVGTILSGEGDKPLDELMRFLHDLDAAPAHVLKVLIISREMNKAGEKWIPAYRQQIDRDADKKGERYLASSYTGYPILIPGKTKQIPYKHLENSRHFAGIDRKRGKYARPQRGARRLPFPGRFEKLEELQRSFAKNPNYYNPQRQAALWKQFRNETREARYNFDRKQPIHDALWQEARRFSELPVLPGEMLAQKLGLKKKARLSDGSMGYVPLDYTVPFPDLCEKYLEPGQYHNPKSPRGPLEGIAKLLASRYSDRIYMFILDEAHEAAMNGGDLSAQGLSAMVLAQAATKVVYMTGTLYKGVASSLYYLEFAINPRIRELYPWGSVTGWVAQMGVLERIVKIKKTTDGKGTGKASKSETVREAPGASPTLLAEVIDHTLFVGIKDLGNVLPPFVEQGIPVQMDAVMTDIYAKASYSLTEYLKACLVNGDNSFLGAYMVALLNWANWPYDDYEVWHIKTVENPITGVKTEFPNLIYIIPGLGYTYISPKEKRLVETVRDSLSKNRGVAIYFRQTGKSARNPSKDILKRMADLLKAEVSGAKPAILKSTVPTGKREEWLAARKAEGVNILLCNPNLVKTGLDMIEYPDIIWYELEFSLPTVDQASHRAWRPGQTEDCFVSFMFYVQGKLRQEETIVEGDMLELVESFMTEHGAVGEVIAVVDDRDEQPAEIKLDTMEAKGVRLIDLKRLAAAFLYGEEGASLSAMSDVGDLKDDLAKEIGRDTFVDASDMFKRAAEPVEADDTQWTQEDEQQAVEALEESAPVTVTEPKVKTVETYCPAPVGFKGPAYRYLRRADELPKLYSTEKDAQKTVRAKLFIPGGNWRIYVLEYNQKDALAFTYTVNEHGGEFGYTDMQELSEVRVRGIPAFERDLHFQPKSLAKALYADGYTDLASQFEPYTVVEVEAAPVVETPAPEVATSMLENPTPNVHPIKNDDFPIKNLTEKDRKAYWLNDVKKYGQPLSAGGRAMFTVDEGRFVQWEKDKNGEYTRYCVEGDFITYAVKFPAKKAVAA